MEVYIHLFVVVSNATTTTKIKGKFKNKKITLE
jgi:hypothetical protein